MYVQLVISVRNKYIYIPFNWPGVDFVCVYLVSSR